ncbi:hypothetical protein FKM82_019221 [Ascaphus truei]
MGSSWTCSSHLSQLQKLGRVSPLWVLGIEAGTCGSPLWVRVWVLGIEAGTCGSPLWVQVWVLGIEAGTCGSPLWV